MKSIFYINLLTLLFSLSSYSQKRTHTEVILEIFNSENLQKIYELNLEALGEFKSKDSRGIINKTQLSNGFLLIERRFHPGGGSITEKTFYTYDTNNKLIEEFSQTWYYFYWKNQSKVLFQYDSANNLIESIYLTWDGLNWLNGLKTIFTYDGNNNLVERFSQIWNASTWVNTGQKYLCTYDVNINLIEELYQNWADSTWENLYKSTYTYNLNNNEIGYLQQDWDGSIWLNNMKRLLYVYDTNNNLIENQWRYWNGTTWMGIGKNFYAYDENNNLIEFLSLHSGGGNDYKYSYSYDGNNSLTEELYQNWENSAWVNYDRYTFTFDVNNNLTEKIFQNWVESNWTTNYKYTFIYAHIITEINGELSTVDSFKLSNNYPNPFNCSSVINYSIPQLSQVSLKIYNTLGEELETLVDEENTVGTYEVTWNAANLPSGVYLYQLKAGDFVEAKKMILLK